MGLGAVGRSGRDRLDGGDQDVERFDPLGVGGGDRGLGEHQLFLHVSLAVRTLPMGTAYAVWTGLGAAGIAIVGILFFGEPRNLWRIAYIGCILMGIAGLKLTAGD